MGKVAIYLIWAVILWIPATSLAASEAKVRDNVDGMCRSVQVQVNETPINFYSSDADQLLDDIADTLYFLRIGLFLQKPNGKGKKKKASVAMLKTQLRDLSDTLQPVVDSIRDAAVWHFFGGGGIPVAQESFDAAKLSLLEFNALAEAYGFADCASITLP